MKISSNAQVTEVTGTVIAEESTVNYPQERPTEIALERGAILLAALIVIPIALLVCLASPLIFLLSTRAEPGPSGTKHL
jgi:hypothetical protein